MKPSLVVLAAGMGSRFGGVKQITPVGRSGEIIINFSVHDAIEAGFSRVIFVIRKEIEKDFKEVIASQLPESVDVSYAYQELTSLLPEGFSLDPDREKPLGTAHALLCAKDQIDGPFAVINADDYYGKEPFAAMAEYLSNLSPRSTDYAMMGYRLSHTLSPFGTVSRGVCSVAGNGWLSSIVEHLKIGYKGEDIVSTTPHGEEIPMTGNETISMNFFGFSASFLDELEEAFPGFLEEKGHELKTEFLLPAEVDILLKAGRARMKVLPTEAQWFGVTYKEDLPRVKKAMEALVEEGVYRSPLWSPIES